MKNGTGIKIKPGLAKRIYKLAKETRKDVSYHLNKALEEYVAEQEDLKEAMKRLKDMDDEAISPTELRKSLGI
jgi:predicted DNA-binding protein